MIFSLVRLYEFVDQNFVGDKIGNWMMSREILKFKIIPNQYSNTSVADMEKFFLMMHSIYSSKGERGFRTTGEFFDEFSIEITAKDGDVNMYIVIYKSNLGTLMGASKLYLPNVQFVQVLETEIDQLPKSYYEASQIWKEIHLGEFGQLKNEVFPTKLYDQIEHSLPEYKQNPITQLFNYLTSVNGGDMVTLQIILRPQDDKKKSQELNSELAKVRKEFNTNSMVATSADGTISQLTKHEVETLESIEKHINAQNFDTKIRFALFGKTSTGKKYLGGIMTYWKIFGTDHQAIIPTLKSWQDSDSVTWGNLLDKLYHQPTSLRKTVDYYDGFKSRSLGIGGKSKFWSIYSLSTIFQIPSVYVQKNNVKAYHMPNVIEYLNNQKQSGVEDNKEVIELDVADSNSNTNVYTNLQPTPRKTFEDFPSLNKFRK